MSYQLQSNLIIKGLIKQNQLYNLLQKQNKTQILSFLPIRKIQPLKMTGLLENSLEIKNEGQQQVLANKSNTNLPDEKVEVLDNEFQQKVQQKIEQNTEIIQQKLQVAVVQKPQAANPQNSSTQQQKTPQNSSRYGPFHSLSPNAQALLNSQPINYALNIQPILTNLSPKQIKRSPRTTKNVKQKKSQSILTQESVHQQSSRANPQELEKQILQLAKNIRKKVWKKQVGKVNIEDNKSNLSGVLLKKEQNKETGTKLRQLYQKRQSLFDKYSYPHSTGVTLADLQSQEKKLNQNRYNLSRVYKEQPQEQQPTESQHQKQTLTPTISPNPQHKFRSHSRTQQSNTARKSPQLPKLKLNFDKTHHKYQMTEFRKSILRENKEREIAKSLLIKEKEQTLQKRREIYNNSRYHPVGVKLSALRISKLGNSSILHKEAMTQIQIKQVEHPQTHNELENSTHLAQINTLQHESVQQPQHILSHQKSPFQQPQKHFNASQAKSSLTFNFSFGDPVQSSLKSQAQVYNEVQNLTKLLQNDSTPQEKIQKLQQKQKAAKQHNHEKEIKKQTAPNIDKEMTESKVIGDVQLLHNSSMDDYDDDKDVELQYSCV